MRTKAVDIARALGISKSTVSLALNGKPGVSEKTRQEIETCRRLLEEGKTYPQSVAVSNTAETEAEKTLSRQIKVVRVINGMKNIQGAELDLWTDVNEVFVRNLRENGYSLGLVYADFREQDLSAMLEECSGEDVAGVIIYGTELREEDTAILQKIRKPMVIYDAVLKTDQYPMIVIDNRQGVELSVNELLSKGNREITYLSNPMPMYNYQSRQRGFLEIMKNRGYGDASDRIVPVGSSIEECHQAMLRYFQNHELPDAFIAESYHVTMGTVMAAQELGIRIPGDVSLVGVDALPSYLTGGINVTSIRVPHTERAYWAIQMLLKEITHPVKEKCRLYSNCVLVDGESVRRRET
jgi:LacI family transcriptional regulator